MAAIYGQTERTIELSGQACQVPSGNLASLSYYLCCVNSLITSHEISADIINWRSTQYLSSSKREALIGLAFLLSPEELLNKLFIADDNHALLPNGSSNKFLNLNEITHVVAIAADTVVGGKQTQVTKVMLCTTEWFDRYWIVPMKNLKYEVAKVANKPVQDIQAYLGSVELQLQLSRLSDMIGALDVSSSTTDHCSHCKGGDARCACDKGCARKPESKCTDHPTTQCDSCMTQGLRGDRYKCRECADVDLCSRCYLDERGGHVRCCFSRISKEGEPPVVLAPRVQLDHPDVTCGQCKKSGFDGPRYQCKECSNSNLCQSCYWSESDSHLHCRFWRINKKEGPKIDQEPRYKKPPPVAPTYAEMPFARAVPVTPVSPTAPFGVSVASAYPMGELTEGQRVLPSHVSNGCCGVASACPVGELTEGQRVRVKGLPNHVCNGCCGVVVKELPGGQKYVVNIPSEGKKVFQAENLEGVVDTDPKYPLDACVELKDLSTASENGKYGVIVGQVNGKILVRLLDENRTLKVKKENVSVIEEAG